MWRRNFFFSFLFFSSYLSMGFFCFVLLCFVLSSTKSQPSDCFLILGASDNLQTSFNKHLVSRVKEYDWCQGGIPRCRGHRAQLLAFLEKHLYEMDQPRIQKSNPKVQLCQPLAIEYITAAVVVCTHPVQFSNCHLRWKMQNSI